MNREEKLTKLHKITVKVRLTILESEGAIECQYLTSNGEKNEWIGIDEWPASKSEKDGKTEYKLIIDEETLIFNDYKNFEECFSRKWIGEVTPWEEYSDDALDSWIELADNCDGIPFI